MAAGSIVLDLLMRTGSFETDTDRAAKRLKKFEREAQQSASAIGSAFSGLLSGVVGALGVREISQFVSNTVNGIDALNDFADAFGVTVEKASALDDVARRNGESLDTFGQAMQRVNSALTEGGKGADVLQKIGLGAAELQRLSPDEQLLRIARAFSVYADDGEKARALQELFGKNARDIAPLLKDLAEAGELNATVTKQQAEEAERFNKQLGFLKANAVDAARAMTGPLVTGLNELIERYKVGQKEGEGFLKFLARQTEIGRLLGLSSQANTGGATGDFGGPLPSLGNATPSPSRGGAGGGLNLALIDEYRSSSGRAPRAPRAPTDYFNNAQNDLEDRIRKRLEAIEESEVRAIESEQRLRAESEVTADAILMGYDQLEQARLAVPGALEAIAEQTKKTSDFARDMGLTFASAFEDAIVNGEKLSDVLKGLAQDILRILVRQTVTEPLGNLVSSMFGGARANGGPVMGGSTYLVGERGPELFTPSTSGAIIPNGALGGGLNVTINNTASNVVETTARRRDDGQLEVLVRRIVRAENANDLRTGGGPISSGLKARGMNLDGALPTR